MSPRDWLDLASVYQAGAIAARRMAVHPEIGMSLQARVLDSMAERCEQIAAERNTLTEEGEL
jgi:hypothetical protein